MGNPPQRKIIFRSPDEKVTWPLQGLLGTSTCNVKLLSSNKARLRFHILNSISDDPQLAKNRALFLFCDIAFVQSTPSPVLLNNTSAHSMSSNMELAPPSRSLSHQ